MGQLRRMQYDHAAACGRTDGGSKQTVSGVSIIWDPGRLRLIGDVSTVVPHRVLRATFEVVGSRRRRQGGCGRGTGGCGVDRQTQREAVSECNATMTVSGQWLTKKTGI